METFVLVIVALVVAFIAVDLYWHRKTKIPHDGLYSGRPPNWPGYEVDDHSTTDMAVEAARNRFQADPPTGFKAPPPGGFTGLAARAAARRGDAGFVPSRRLPRSTVSFSPRQLEQINTKRRLRGQSPLNRKGFQAAIAAAPIKSTGSDDWLTYLVMYEVLFADHTGRAPDSSITITPDAPYNGHGGEFAGAGASGDWSTPEAPAPAPSGPDPYGQISNDPAPAPSSDSSSSYSSSDSSSSSSSDSSSSSSSDSGSSSGGGGGD